MPPRRLSSILIALAACAAALPGLAQTPPRQRDQDAALAARKAGEIKPLREIEGRVVPRMSGARYLGPEMHDNGRYRLKFMRGDSVIWVDVDGRTGAILGRSGN